MNKIKILKNNPDYWNKRIPVSYQDANRYRKEIYEMRIKNLWNMPESKQYDAIIIYGDREHFSNIDYLIGYDARWEETLLVLTKKDKPLLIVGNEGAGYAARISIEYEQALFQTFSLMGQPNDHSKKLDELLRLRLTGTEKNVGLIGFKSYNNTYHNVEGLLTDVPHYIVKTIELIVNENRLYNATDLLTDCAYGLKHNLDVEEIICFEARSTKVSSNILNSIRKLQEGISETEAAKECTFDGSPLNMHPIFSFGDENVSFGSNSPTETTTLKYGDAISIGYGLRGAFIHRCGMYIRNADDLPIDKENYLTEFLYPYFDTTCHWYEMMEVGTCFGDIYNMVDLELGIQKFGIGLSPGHLTNTDEWTNSPFARDNSLKIRSGMAIQCDFGVSIGTMNAHLEDGIIIADDNLRQQIKEKAPDCFERMEARRKFMIEELKVNIPEEALPTSDLCCICFPFMADTSCILARE
jgi:hypothetical protein